MFSILTDLSFRRFVTPRLVRLIYFISLIGAALSALAWMLSGFKTSVFYGVFTFVFAFAMRNGLASGTRKSSRLSLSFILGMGAGIEGGIYEKAGLPAFHPSEQKDFVARFAPFLR